MFCSLLNPVKVKRQVLGVYSKELLRPLAEILQRLGSEEVMVVHSQDGLDELSLGAPTDVVHLKSGELRSYTINPVTLGFKYASIQRIKGGDAVVNAAIITGILSGTIKNQYRDIVLLNAAAGLVVAGCAHSMKEGVSMAKECIDTGSAIRLLHQLQMENEVRTCQLNS